MSTGTVLRMILYVGALVLTGLAVFQSTDPSHRAALALGEVTKVITAVIAVVLAHLVQPPGELSLQLC
jgi:uncharacterized membrane protein YjdF